MTKRESEYRNTVGLISCSLLIFCVAFTVFGIFMTYFPLWLGGLPLALGDAIYQLVYAVMYAAVFLAPVLYFQKAHNRACPPEDLRLKITMGKNAFLYLFAGLAVIHAAAMVNAELFSIFEYALPSAPTTGFWVQESATNAQLISQLIVFAVVPPFVEELLFRGVVLSNLMPFGKTQAVLASALLFGLMHQNLSQILYATVAGLVLGYIYVQTRSIWPCVLLHFVNNAWSVLQTAWVERMPADTALAVYTALQALVYAAGVLCAILLILRSDKTEEEKAENAPAATEADTAPAQTEDGGETIPAARRAKLFFTPTTIAFFVVCAVQALLTFFDVALL